jgi:hypothetical protein
MKDEWIDKGTLDAIASLGTGGDRAAVEQVLESVARGTMGAGEREFCRALATALLTAANRPGADRRDAIVRATGLTGATIAHSQFIEFARAAQGFDGVTIASIIRMARERGYLASDPDAPDYLDDKDARKVLARAA